MTIAQSRPASGTSTARAAMLDHLAPLIEAAAGQEAATLISASVGVPAVDPIGVYATATPNASLWMQPGAGVALVGIGEAWSVESSGRARFGDVAQAWSDLLDRAHIDTSSAPRGAGPLLLGGFAFLDEPVASTMWSAFPSASLVLPSLLLTVTPGGAWLTLSLMGKPGLQPRERIEDLLSSWESLTGQPPTEPAGSATAVLRVISRRPEAAVWRDSVARLAGAVGRGRLDKAVLSRRVSVEGSEPIDVPATLRRLSESAPESTIFAVTRGTSTFLGATPERLVNLQDRTLHTMAMAGSTRRAETSAPDDVLAEQLLQSDKEREEHAVVVTMLREALTPLVQTLEVQASPIVERFRHVQHLVTPISGRLRADADVLALVGRLHPTPAVGGAPRDLALELIAEEEPDDRGWYAGPLGWVDRHGDGEFVVALRSGLVHGQAATLFAGCGIVADSDPEREWEESATKLLALGSAIGRIEP